MNANAQRKSRRERCRRNKSQRGAGLGNSYSFGPAVGEVNNFRASVVPYSSCGDSSARPGFLNASTPTGLPGLSGGRRRDEVVDLMDSTMVDYPDAASPENQMGGRYTTDFEVTGPGIPLANHPSIPNNVATQNPLNQGYDIRSLVTSTGAQAALPAPLKGGKRKTRKTRKSKSKSKKTRKSRKSKKSKKASRKQRK